MARDEEDVEKGVDWRLQEVDVQRDEILWAELEDLGRKRSIDRSILDIRRMLVCAIALGGV